MVFATDSDPGKRIMRSLYEEAAVEFPRMIKEHRELRARMEREAEGIVDLFSGTGIEVPVVGTGERIRLPDDPPEGPRPHVPSEGCRFCAQDAPWEDVEEPEDGEYLLDEDL